MHRKKKQQDFYNCKFQTADLLKFKALYICIYTNAYTYIHIH